MKKNLLLTITLSSAVLFSHAQIIKGTVFLGGNIGVSASKQTYNYPNSPSTEYENVYLNINPSVGIALKENTVFGISLNYGQNINKSSNNNEPHQSNHSYEGGAYLRKYMTLGKGFYLFGNVGAGFFESKQFIPIDNTNSTKQKYTSIGISLYPGIAYAVNKNFHLEIGMNSLANMDYSKTSTESNNGGIKTSTSSRSLSFYNSFSSSSPFNIGFRFAFPK